MRSVEYIDDSRFRSCALDAKLTAIQSPPKISNSPELVAHQKYLNHSGPAAPHRDTYVVLYIKSIATDVNALSD